MPVPTAGKAIVFNPRSAAIRNECATELRKIRRGRSSAKLHAGRMNHVPRFQFAAAGNGRVADWDASDFIAFALDFFSAPSPDRSRNAGAQLQIVVRSIDDRVRIHLRQVALLDHDFF